jgi:hypothetical protein
MNPKARLALSLHVVTGWEHVPPGGRFADTMRLIRDELAVLRQLKADDPTLAAQVEQLEARYGAIALKLSFG